MSTFKIGDKVLFGRTHGEQTLGTVVKVNSTTVVVAQDETRGMQRIRQAGTKWKVPFHLVRHVGAAPATTTVAPVRPKRTDAAIMSDILGCYCDLSPENLSCDGELSRAQTVGRARAIRARLVTLFGEIGRSVSEDVAYAWSDRQSRAA